MCWLLSTFQSDAASAHWRRSLVSDKHVHASRFQSASPGSGVVFMQPGVKVNGAYYCNVWLLKQLLQYSSSMCCQTAGDFLLSSAPRVHKSTEPLRHKTPNFTPDMWPPNRPDLSPVDYRLLSHLGIQQGMSNIVDELWLLTEWHIVKRTYYISQGRV